MNPGAFVTELFRKIDIELDGQAGYSEEELTEAEERLNVSLPAVLRSYYGVSGKHPINQAHNRLIDLSKVELLGGYLVFLEENQGAAVWGLPSGQLVEDDPIVWQGEVGTKIDWQSEGLRLSEFLEISLYWQAACGGLEFSGMGSGLEQNQVDTVENHWPHVKTHGKMRFYVKPGQVLVLNAEENGTSSLLAAGTTLDHFATIDEQVGIEWDWSIFDELEGEDEDEVGDDEDVNKG